MLALRAHRDSARAGRQPPLGRARSMQLSAPRRASGRQRRVRCTGASAPPGRQRDACTPPHTRRTALREDARFVAARAQLQRSCGPLHLSTPLSPAPLGQLPSWQARFGPGRASPSSPSASPRAHRTSQRPRGRRRRFALSRRLPQRSPCARTTHLHAHVALGTPRPTQRASSVLCVDVRRLSRVSHFASPRRLGLGLASLAPPPGAVEKGV
jgi:hypothetical protein